MMMNSGLGDPKTEAGDLISDDSAKAAYLKHGRKLTLLRSARKDQR